MNEEQRKRLAELRKLDERNDDQEAELMKLEGLEADEKMQRTINAAVEKAIGSTEKEEEKEDRKVEVYNKDVTVGDDLTPNWMKRTAAYFNAVVAHGQDRVSDLQKYKRELSGYTESVTDQMRNAEMAEARRNIKDSGLSRIQQVRALSTLTGAAGGDLLPKPFLSEVFVIIEERGVARNFFRGVPMGSKDLDLKDVATKPVVNWTDEAADISESQPSFGNQKLDTKKLAALTPWTTELQEDEVFGLLPILQELFAEAILEKEDEAGFIGDGSSTYGGFTGILNLAGAQTFTMANGSTSFFDTTADDYRKLVDQVSLARRRNARYFMHPDIISHIERLKDADGNYIYRKPGDDSRPATLWGYPVTLTEVMPNASDDAAETKFVVFGDPNRMLFGTRRGITLMTSMEGAITSGNNVSFNALTNDGAILRITERIGFKAPIEDAFANLETAAT